MVNINIWDIVNAKMATTFGSCTLKAPAAKNPTIHKTLGKCMMSLNNGIS